MSADEPQFLSLPFSDGLVHLISVPSLPKFSASYYAPTSIIAFSGVLRRDGDKLRFAPTEADLEDVLDGDGKVLKRNYRTIQPASDRAGFVANFAAESTFTVVPHDDALVHETRGLIAKYSPKDVPHRKFMVRIQQDIPLHAFPDPPWEARPEGIYDTENNLVYQRVAGAAPTPPVPSTGMSFVDRVRGLFAGSGRK